MDPNVAISVIAQTISMYEKLLHLDFRAAGDRFDRMRIQLLTQRILLQRTRDVFQSGGVEMSSESFSNFLKTLEVIQKEFTKVFELERHYPSWKVGSGLNADLSCLPMRWATGDCNRMQESLIQLTTLIDGVESILPQPTYHHFSSEGVRSSSIDSKNNTTIQPISMTSNILRDEMEPQNQDNAQMFLSLCLVCEKVLKIISSHSVALKNVFLSYLLWARSIQNENIAATFMQSPADIDNLKGPNLLTVHYEILIQMAFIFS